MPSVTFQAVPTTAAAMAAAAAAAVSGVTVPGLTMSAPAIPGASRVVVLSDAVTLEEITNDEEYGDILEVCACREGRGGRYIN